MRRRTGSGTGHRRELWPVLVLLVLTVADIRAVGPNVWNGWKGQLLRGLYYRAEAAMTGGDTLADQEQRVAMAKDDFRETLSDWPEAALAAFVDRAYPSYWLNFNTEVHARHAAFVVPGYGVMPGVHPMRCPSGMNA